MQTESPPLKDESTIEESVIIERPVSVVYELYRDFTNLPSFLGDVMNIELTGPATSKWTVQGPLGIQIHWTIQVIEERQNQLIHYETVNSPERRTSWKIYFSAESGGGRTEVREVLRIPVGRIGRSALAFFGKSPTKEVSANLRRLKQLLETGRVTDRSYSVPGKFR